MNKPMRTIAIIPARGGSKGVPRKNVRDFLGKPLVAHSIEHALAAGSVDRVFVSTDDAEIARIAEAWGASVVHRPPALSGDTASSESALIHAVNTITPPGVMTPGTIVFLQATSPIRGMDDVESALRQFESEGADSLVSVCDSHDFHWAMRGGSGVALDYDPSRRPRRQDIEPRFRENGSIYVMRTAGLLRNDCRLFGKVALYRMDQMRSFQIDTPEDFEVCEAIGRAFARRHPGSTLNSTPSRPARRAEA